MTVDERRKYLNLVAPRYARAGRSERVEGFRRVQAQLPFPITHLHPDNGSEFFNDHLIRYFGEAMIRNRTPLLGNSH